MKFCDLTFSELGESLKLMVFSVPILDRKCLIEIILSVYTIFCEILMKIMSLEFEKS